MEVTGSLRLTNSTIIWDIRNFLDQCKEVGDYIDSPPFTVGDISSDKVVWHLRLYPFGEIRSFEVSKTKTPNTVSLFLRSTFNNDFSEIEVLFKLYLWNNNEENMHKFINTKFMKNCPSLGCSCFLARNGDLLKNHLSLSKDSTLSIACNIKVSLHNVDSVSLSKELIKGFSPFFLSDNLSDVTIEIDKKKLKAHKIILSARSEVFKSMFNHDMIESSENVININDISYDVMKEVLRFVYCGEVENLDLLDSDLLAAADKYNIISLKKICEENLLKNLNVSNVCQTLSVSQLYQCFELKERINKFIVKNIKAVVKTNEFDKIQDPKLLADLLREVALND